MATLTLFTFPGDFRAFKARIAAQYNGVKIETPDFNVEKDGQSAEFLAKSPLGTVPLLETPSGCLFESNAIARYVARLRADTNLLGRSFFESGVVDSWCEFSTHEVELPATLAVYPIFGFSTFNEATHASAMSDLHAALGRLEAHLLSRTYMVGEAITLADIVLVSALFYAFKLILDGAAREAYPSVTRWFVTCVNQPAFKAVLGDFVLCEVAHAASGAPAASASAASAAAPAAAGGKKAKDEKPKEKKAKEEKPKEEKPKEAAPKKEKAKKEDDEDAPDVPREEKKANPLAALPKSSMDLDAWKREYSNSKTDYYASMPWFWEHLDAAGYSLWLQNYKFNAENKVAFMVSNLVGGFLQRSDEMRRFAFGCMHVLNSEAPFEVTGVWLFRGDNVNAMLEANPDAEYYEWVRLDHTNEEHKKMVADYWCTSEKLMGKDVYDSKVFK